jgi:hypothetical protein
MAYVGQNMSAEVAQTVDETGGEHEAAVELTDSVDDYWFAEEFSAGEQIALRLGSETSVAEVVGVEPARGNIAVDISRFDRDDLGSGIALPDRSSAGMEMTNLGVSWSIEAVEIGSNAAVGEAVDRVVCDCGSLCQAGRGHSVHASQMVDDGDSGEEGASGDELPHPRDDPTIKYCHEGKRYDVAGSDTTFEIAAFDAETLPELDGLVIIESVDGSRINSEHQHRKGGVSRKVLGEHTPADADRAVWTATGLLSCIRRLEILEDDTGSYRDYYWERQD